MFWEKGQERIARTAETEFEMLEIAVTHGVANVMVKGYAEKRARDKARQRPLEPARPTDGAWARQMAADFPQFVARPSTDGPLAIGAQ